MLIWVFLLLLSFNSVGQKFGIPLLFLDPEYLGSVSWVSFSIVGFGLGYFWVCWTGITYLLNSHRFPFLASLQWPFATFFLNNSLLPLGFLVLFSINVAKFQIHQPSTTSLDTAIMILGLWMGVALMLCFAILYLHYATKAIKPRTGKPIKKRIVAQKIILGDNKNWKVLSEDSNEIYSVLNFLSIRFKRRQTRKVQHYDDHLLKIVFKQHHVTLFVFQIVSILFLFASSFFINQPTLQIPAAANVFVAGSVLISMIGLFYFWTGRWTLLIFALFGGAVFLISGVQPKTQKSQVTGLNYDVPHTPYTIEHLEAIASDSNHIQHSKSELLKTAINWKKETGLKNPTMVLITASGGGLSSSMFTVHALQQADSITNGKLFNQTAMLTGSSGGLIGNTFIRELLLLKHLEPRTNIYDDQLKYWISKDLLNSIWASITSNDIFGSPHFHAYNGHRYRFDRGVMFETKINQNCHQIFEKPLGYYKSKEQQGKIPMLIGTSAIANDSRRMLISPQNLSCFMSKRADLNYTVDAIDFQSMFQLHEADSIPLKTMLRMSANFPYILPPITLPTKPVIELIDAGFRDNFGMETVDNYLYNLQPWLNENVEQVVIVQLRLNHKKRRIRSTPPNILIQELLSPISVLYRGLDNSQDYLHDKLIQNRANQLDIPLNVVRFQLHEDVYETKAAISFRLTDAERNYIIESINHEENQAEMEKLKQLLN